MKRAIPRKRDGPLRNLYQVLKESELDDSLNGLRGLHRGIVDLSHNVTRGLRVDAVENLARTFISRCRLNGGDDIVVVEVFRTEQVDVRTALIALRGTLAAIVAVTTVLFLGSLDRKSVV